MKSFMYTYKRGKLSANDKFSIYRVKNNTPELIIKNAKFSYRSEFQAVFEELQSAGYIPKSLKIEDVGHASFARNDGIVNITAVSI